VVTPAVEMQMGFGFPATGRLLRAGLRPGLGVDVVTSTGSDLFTRMRAALQAQRVLALAGDEGKPAATTRDVLGFATIEGARSVGLDAKTGSLTPGKEADVVLLRADALSLTPLNDPVGAVVLAAHPGARRLGLRGRESPQARRGARRRRPGEGAALGGRVARSFVREGRCGGWGQLDLGQTDPNDATRRGLVHRAEPYSLNLVERLYEKGASGGNSLL
jgi:cytosine/adenosine deaminase-related metal-dependent hydrolase